MSLIDEEAVAVQVEDPKKALLLYGNRTSQTIKDVLSDIGKLKAVSASCLNQYII